MRRRASESTALNPPMRRSAEKVGVPGRETHPDVTSRCDELHRAVTPFHGLRNLLIHRAFLFDSKMGNSNRSIAESDKLRFLRTAKIRQHPGAQRLIPEVRVAPRNPSDVNPFERLTTRSVPKLGRSRSEMKSATFSTAGTSQIGRTLTFRPRSGTDGLAPSPQLGGRCRLPGFPCSSKRIPCS